MPHGTLRSSSRHCRWARGPLPRRLAKFCGVNQGRVNLGGEAGGKGGVGLVGDKVGAALGLLKGILVDGPPAAGCRPDLPALELADPAWSCTLRLSVLLLWPGLV